MPNDLSPSQSGPKRDLSVCAGSAFVCMCVGGFMAAGLGGLLFAVGTAGLIVCACVRGPQ